MMNNVLNEFNNNAPWPTEEPMRFTVRQTQPRTKNNPDTDYKKLFLMVGAALLAAVIYDRARNN